jgi:hypothetical protein
VLSRFVTVRDASAQKMYGILFKIYAERKSKFVWNFVASCHCHTPPDSGNLPTIFHKKSVAERTLMYGACSDVQARLGLKAPAWARLEGAQAH